MSTITVEQRKTIIKLYEEGYSAYDIRIKLQINSDKIKAILIISGKIVKRRWNYHYEKLIIAKKYGYASPDEMLLSLYKDKKLTPSAIGKIMEVSTTTARYRLKRLGVNLGSPGGPNNVKLTETARAKIKAVPTLTKKIKHNLAKKFNVHHATIYDCYMGVTKYGRAV